MHNASDAHVQYRPLFNDRGARIGRQYYYRVIANNAVVASVSSNVAGPVTVRCHTVVDEFWNRSQLYHHTPDLVLYQNEARKFKEDCHRLGGPEGSFLVYHVPGDITGIRLYAFAEEQGKDLGFSVSTDGRDYGVVALSRTDYSGGPSYYGYWIPLLFDTEQLPKGTQYLKITFKSNAQLSRVEVAYTD